MENRMEWYVKYKWRYIDCLILPSGVGDCPQYISAYQSSYEMLFLEYTTIFIRWQEYIKTIFLIHIQIMQHYI